MTEEALNTEERLTKLEEKTEMLLRNQKLIVYSLKETQETAEEALRILKRLEPPTNDNHNN